jgi:hypothetical protein
MGGLDELRAGDEADAGRAENFHVVGCVGSG